MPSNGFSTMTPGMIPVRIHKVIALFEAGNASSGKDVSIFMEIFIGVVAACLVIAALVVCGRTISMTYRTIKTERYPVNIHRTTFRFALTCTGFCLGLAFFEYAPTRHYPLPTAVLNALRDAIPLAVLGVVCIYQSKKYNKNHGFDPRK